MLRFLIIYFSLITCSPGEELYASYGHTAIRMQDTEQDIDWCFNYGTFSFDTDNFYWKFLRGETVYCLSVSTTNAFVCDYLLQHRKVYEQPLRLTEEQSLALQDALINNCQPENRDYLYNFVYDNCATRPYELIKCVYGDSLRSTYPGWEGRTYREFIRHYTRPHTVMDALINMIFGPQADRPMYGEQRLFLPEELMNYLENAVQADGTPVVEQSSIGPFPIRETRWWENVYVYLVLFVVLMTLLSWYDRRRGRLSYGVDIALGAVYVLVLLLVVFLIYFSIHPLVGWNWRIAVLPLLHLCSRLVYILR